MAGSSSATPPVATNPEEEELKVLRPYSVPDQTSASPSVCCENLKCNLNSIRGGSVCEQKRLMEMGFSERVAKKALEMSNYNLEAAFEMCIGRGSHQLDM